MDLMCNENIIYEDDLSFDGGLDAEDQSVGIRSFEDPRLIKDQRVLRNVLKDQIDYIHNGKYDYFQCIQTEVKPHMRKIVTDWILEVTEEQKCHPEVFFLAVDYLDRFLSKVNIHKSQFQLVACVCMFIASKFKETVPLCADNLVVYTDFSVTTQEITQWELLILNVLGWDLSAITPYCIMDQLLRRLDFDTTCFNMPQIRRHAETFLALAATEYQFYHYSGALIAVSCLTAALGGMKRTPKQAEIVRDAICTFTSITGFNSSIIMGCVTEIEDNMRLRIPSSPNHSNETSPSPPPQVVPSINISSTTSSTKSSSSSNSISYSSNNPPSSTPTDVMEIAPCVY